MTETLKLILGLVSELEEATDQFFGVYLDAIVGFASQRRDHISSKLKIDADPVPIPPGIQTFVSHGRLIPGGKPHRPVHIHQVKIEEAISRNSHGGSNSIFVGRMVIVSIFAIWDDHIRPKLEVALSAPKGSLSVPIFGDIRRLRRMIVHNRSIMDTGARKMELLRWFKEGELVSPSKSQIEEMVDRVFEFTRDFQRNPRSFIVEKRS